jgi:peptidoglycan/LPS O-acetylase OafA/YrhL
LSALVTSPADTRLLPSGLEAGTAPGDRRFRPDVEGLRAVAVLLVVLFHAGVPHLTGGYVGVDVFFVISGFVITGVLLRERESTGGTSIIDFYARRVRRILPAATLVIVVVAFVAYLMLGYAAGTLTANDGRWAAVFLVNFHFTSVGTNYLASQLPPSPLQNFWSLSVEEQFYVVFPTLIIVVAALRRSVSFRARLAVTLVAVIIASYVWSIVQTANNPTAAYFSPFTRAWELALGALITVGTVSLKKIPPAVAAAMTWAGLAAIVVSAFAFTSTTAYPGSLVAVPVVGAALIIAGGIVVPAWGAERLLGLTPFRLGGKISYSLYLWHWPVLILAAEHYGKTQLGVGQNLLLLLLALAISVVTYLVFENPIRQMRIASRLTVALGVVTIAATVAIMTFAIHHNNSLGYTKFHIVPAPSQAAVVEQVAASRAAEATPHVLDPPVAQAAANRGNFGYVGCVPGTDASTEPVNEPSCELGDQASHRRMVVYGDSHALMWLPAFDAIAKSAHMKLSILGKPGCEADLLHYTAPKGLSLPAGSPFTACDQWNRWARTFITKTKPAVLVITQDAPVREFTPAQWESGLAKTLDAVRSPGMRTFVLGNNPVLPTPPPQCLALHPTLVQFCSGTLTTLWTPFNHAERAAAAAHGATYVDPTPWFCSDACPAIIGHYEVYSDSNHITAAYAQYLSNVLGQALGLRSATPAAPAATTTVPATTGP